MSFKKAASAIQNAVNQGTKQALNKALKSTVSEVRKDLRRETGLSAADVKAKVFEFKANKDPLNVAIKINTAKIPVDKFGPTEKVVKKRANREGQSKAQKFYGTSVKLGSFGKQLIPGAFMRTVRGKPMVLARKDAFTTNNSNAYTGRKTAPRPMMRLLTDIVKRAAQIIKGPAENRMLSLFKASLSEEITKALMKRIK